jgi:hypothetical protein
MAEIRLTRTLLSIVVGGAITVAIIDPADHAIAAATRENVSLSAASKKSVSSQRRRERGQIACTVSGCQPIPPGCHPQTGYNWDGIPTGCDIVVCRPRG